MPANLPPEYFEIEKKYRQATTIQEKIGFLEKMLAVMPKHKGTDRLREELTKKLARLEEQSERKLSIGKKGAQQYVVKKEGAGQVALVGLTNSGKSSLLKALTSASPQIAPYPYTTLYPQPGMMRFEDIWIQLIDLPPLTGEEPGWLVHLLRAADALVILVDLQEDPIAQTEFILDNLSQKRIKPVGKVEDTDIRVWYKGMIIAGNKVDLEGAWEKFLSLKERFKEFPVYAISAERRSGLEELALGIFNSLGIIRVYTKGRWEKAEVGKTSEPLILPKGSTVKEAAYAIHKDFVYKLKYAIIWGSGKFDGQKVGKDYPLQDGDIVELHL